MRLPCAVFVLAMTCASAQAQTAASDEQQIRSQIQAYDTTTESTASFFTSDAVFWSGAYIRPHRRSEPAAARQADDISTPGRKNQKQVTTVDRITIAGDSALEYSKFTLTFDDNEGHKSIEGALLRGWQRESSTWKIAAVFQRPYGRVVAVDQPPWK